MGANGPEVNLPGLPCCAPAAEEDKSEAGPVLCVVGRNVGKKRQFSYWCPWALEEEQT